MNTRTRVWTRTRCEGARASATVSTRDRARRSRRRQHGFTVIELLIVVTIGALLAMVAIPSMRDVLNNTRQSSALGLLVSDLNLARGEAIKRNARVVVCVRDTAALNAVPNCETGGAGTDWRAGWLVCIAAAGADTCAAATAANPNPLVVRPALDPSLTLVSTARAIRFVPNSSAVAATLTLGGSWSGASNRVVNVAVTGNISK